MWNNLFTRTVVVLLVLVPFRTVCYTTEPCSIQRYYICEISSHYSISLPHCQQFWTATKSKEPLKLSASLHEHKHLNLNENRIQGRGSSLFWYCRYEVSQLRAVSTSSVCWFGRSGQTHLFSLTTNLLYCIDLCVEINIDLFWYLVVCLYWFYLGILINILSFSVVCLVLCNLIKFDSDNARRSHGTEK